MKRIISWQSIVFVVIATIIVIVVLGLVSFLTGLRTIPSNIGMTTLLLSVAIPLQLLDTSNVTLHRWILRGIVAVIAALICSFAAAGIFAITTAVQPLYFRLFLTYVVVAPLAVLALPLTIERDSPMGQALFTRRTPLWKVIGLLLILVGLFAGLDSFWITYLPL